VILLGGCGDGDGLDRAAVSGQVTLDGAPLERGSIRFVPKDGDSRGAAWGEVAAGAYAIPAADGPVAGEYVVTITPAVETDGVEAGGQPELPGDPPPDAIDGPAVVYTSTAPLEATIAPGGPNTFDFGLTSITRKARPQRR